MSGLIEVQLLNGIVQGMIYALVAAGLTLIFGMLDIPNFAHGAFYALGAYVAFTVVSATGNFWLAIAVVPLVVAGLGLLVDAFAMRRLARAGHVYQILFTLGLVLIVQEAIVLIWGADPISGRSDRAGVWIVSRRCGLLENPKVPIPGCTQLGKLVANWRGRAQTPALTA